MRHMLSRRQAEPEEQEDAKEEEEEEEVVVVEVEEEETSLGVVQSRRHTAYSHDLHTSAYVSIRQHTSAYVSIRQHTSECVRIRQHTSAYVSIRQHTSCSVISRPAAAILLPIEVHIKLAYWYMLSRVRICTFVPVKQGRVSICIWYSACLRANTTSIQAL
jgi:hypothetical protein